MLTKKLLGANPKPLRFDELGASTIPSTLDVFANTWNTIIPTVPMSGLQGDTLFVLLYSYGVTRFPPRIEFNTLDLAPFNVRLIDGSTVYSPSQASIVADVVAILTVWRFDNVVETSTASLQMNPSKSDWPVNSSHFCRTFATKNYSYSALSGRVRTNYSGGPTGSLPLSVTVDPKGVVLGAIVTVNDMAMRFSDARMTADYVDDFRSTELALLANYSSPSGETVSTSYTNEGTDYASALLSFNPA